MAMRTVSGVLAMAAATALLAGCGSSTAKTSDPGHPSSGPDPRQRVERANAPNRRGIRSRYGPILSDGHGRALYLFTADGAGVSHCSGACAAAWPPYLVNSRPVAGAGAKGRLIGTTTRDDGRPQATYRGHPLYYYV